MLPSLLLCFNELEKHKQKPLRASAMTHKSNKRKQSAYKFQELFKIQKLQIDVWSYIFLAPKQAEWPWMSLFSSQDLSFSICEIKGLKKVSLCPLPSHTGFDSKYFLRQVYPGLCSIFRHLVWSVLENLLPNLSLNITPQGSIHHHPRHNHLLSITTYIPLQIW